MTTRKRLLNVYQEAYDTMSASVDQKLEGMRISADTRAMQLAVILGGTMVGYGLAMTAEAIERRTDVERSKARRS